VIFMKREIINHTLIPLILTANFTLVLIFQGCGGKGPSKVSVVSGTVSDINRNMIVGAKVWVEDKETVSLQTGTYRLPDVPSGWQTIWAQAKINGETWIGSTAVEVLRNEPTMNAHIVLAPLRQTTDIRGRVRDDTNHPVKGARVLLTTRLINPPKETSAYDGPYGSIVAVTDRYGEYVLRNVPVGLKATIAASKVGFYNDERSITTARGQIINFTLEPSNLQYKIQPPILDAIEAYTMPDTITKSGVEAYRAVQAITSPRFLRYYSKRNSLPTRSTPRGSLIEIDLYWNALDINYSDEIAGYGIYRRTRAGLEKAIDFVRDPYANFYSDTDIAITPYTNYSYAVTTVDVEFLDIYNQPDPYAESEKSNWLDIRPLGPLQAQSPNQGETVDPKPLFKWSSVPEAAYYKVFVYDEFPTLAADPSRDYTSPTPPPGVVTLPIWPRTLNSTETTVSAGTTSLRYNGPALVPGRTYYWLVMAKDKKDTAFSYSELRHFTVR
jgi:hypothetical protein